MKFVIAGPRRLRVRARRRARGTVWPDACAAVLFSPVHGVLAPADAGASGCSPIACRSACSCRCTSTSGARTRGASDGRTRGRPAVAAARFHTAAAIARREGFALYALTIRYGQRTRARSRRRAAWRAALGVARHLELDVDLRGVRRLGADVGDGDVPQGSRRSTPPTFPSTYVPARNTIFLSLALGWAEVLGAERIVIGVNALDYSGYPDCRPEFIAAFEQLAALATRAGVEGRPLRVRAPLST